MADINDFYTKWDEIAREAHNFDFKMQSEWMNKLLLTQPFVIYGAGVFGVYLAKLFFSIGKKDLYFCDTYKTGTDPTTGLKIISLSELLEHHEDTMIFICSPKYHREIEATLQDVGINPDRIIPMSKLLILLFSYLLDHGAVDNLNSKLAVDFVVAYAYLRMLLGNIDSATLDKLAEVYGFLADEKSKTVFLNRFRNLFHILGHEYDPPADQYFDRDIIAPEPNEVFVDCGMFTGDTAEVFFKFSKNKYEHYFGFEPVEDLYKKATDFLKGVHNVTIEQKGVFSTSCTIVIDGMSCSGASYVDYVYMMGKSFINVVPLDAYFADKPHIPTFIKMDVEGAEMEALKGAEKIIREHKPKLAICVYHKAEDIYEIPLFIRSIRDDYTFYLRHYSVRSLETVLYAI